MLKKEIAQENGSLKTEILDAARILYVKDGYQGLSMRKVASLVGISAAAIYRYYENKEELVFTLATESINLFNNYLHKTQEQDTAFMKFVMVGQAYKNFALKKPHHYRLIFMSPEAWLSEEKQAEIQAYYNESVAKMETTIEQCVEFNIIKKESTKDLAQMLWGTAHGMNMLFLDGKLGFDENQYHEFFDNAFNNIFKGILHKKEDWKEA